MEVNRQPLLFTAARGLNWLVERLCALLVGIMVVVIWFDPVAEGASTRLRIWETYTDAGRYVLDGEELVWDRGFGRPRNTVVLPDGWYLTTNAVPGVIDRTEDGRVRIRYVNPRPDQIQVFIKASRR